MINLDKNLIIANGQDKTSQIEHYKYDGGKYWITFKGGKVYPYNYNSVEIDKDPIKIDTNNSLISYKGTLFYRVLKALKFSGYTRIYFENGSTVTHKNCELSFVKSVLNENKSKKLFQYYKDIATEVGLKSDAGQNILRGKYDKIDFVREDSVLAAYFSGTLIKKKPFNDEGVVYPFGFNESQKKAVQNALLNQISIIEGPPGTGKTQTILNIIANVVMMGKTVAVVSSSNEATKNVQEKLSKNDVDFISAYLGSGKNKEDFINSQKGEVPDLSSWKIEKEDYRNLYSLLVEKGTIIDKMLESKNKLSEKKEEYDKVLIEKKHFDEYYNKANADGISFKFNKKINSKEIMNLWIQLENNGDSKFSLFEKVKYAFRYGLWRKVFFDTKNLIRITIFQNLFYEMKLKELNSEINLLKGQLEKFDFDKCMKEYSTISMRLFKSCLQQKYIGISSRQKYTMEDLWKHSEKFICDYPVILSTTYSLRSSLSSKFIYDYVIVDEASQVDLATGVLAISCAKNAVIVGDLKQLSTVIKPKIREKTDNIFKEYNYANNNLLSSVNTAFNDIPRVLLREHYRCDPKIIGFCNQKFYDNQLIILSENTSTKMPIIVYNTVKGNHSRDNTNIREIDVIKEEVIKQQKIDINKDSIGIVTPYCNQTEILQKYFAGTKIKADTVDKFQGQERDIIILSTVNDEISDFVDDPNRLNVAVSRAINQLIVVTNGNESKKNTNIDDLIGYIRYNNFDVIESKVYSIFDYLYKGYQEQRMVYLSDKKIVSDYDSENLMNDLIKDILDKDFNQYDVAVHIPMRMIIKDLSRLTEEEKCYLQNENTHIDFLIYSKIVHKIMLAVEVDGYKYHKEGTKQAERDIKKNKILEKSDIPFIRFKTNESGEKERLIEKLKSVV